MPSLQSRALRLVLRLVVKRHLLRHRRDTADLVAAMRQAFEAGAARQSRVPADMRIVPIDVDGVRGEWVMRRDVEVSDRGILYAHGGGMVACRPLGYRTLTIPLARATGVPVFAVDYRRAPEHRYPVPLDDVVAAYDAMRARLPARGVALAGDSAGGNLALAALLKLRARGEPRPAAAVIALSPWTDLEGTGESVRLNERSDDLLVPPSRDAQLSLAYADATQLRDPLVSPLHGDYAGGPPLLVFASPQEMLLDDARRLVERARAQHVDVTYVLEEGMPHVWPIFPMLPEARRAVATMAAFLQRAWAPALAACFAVVALPGLHGTAARAADSTTAMPAWEAFVKANAAIDDYTETVTAHEVSGSKVEDRVYHFSYKKPSYARSEIISGPGAGGAAVWHGGDKVKGHQGGLLSAFKLVISEHDPRATDLRGKTIEAAYFGWMIEGFNHYGKLTEAPGPDVDGTPTDAVTMVPNDPAQVRHLTKETLLISRTTHLPLRHLGYEGDTLVERETFSEQVLNPGLPVSTFDM